MFGCVWYVGGCVVYTEMYLM